VCVTGTLTQSGSCHRTRGDFPSGRSQKERMHEDERIHPGRRSAIRIGVSSATAGPCTTEIDNLVKILAAKDAGSGPSLGPLYTGEASAALNRARMLDQQGKEAECMEAVRQVKQLVRS
jgi:hypothetical protein